MVLQSIVGCAARVTLVILLPLVMLVTTAETVSAQPSALRFEVRLGHSPTGGAGAAHEPATLPSGRLLAILGKPGSSEPRLSIGQTGKNTTPILGRDVDKLAPN